MMLHSFYTQFVMGTVSKVKTKICLNTSDSSEQPQGYLLRIQYLHLPYTAKSMESSWWNGQSITAAKKMYSDISLRL